ncbi:hypothetical protein M758_12G172400 [Ceratodon purpureus]|nr:hypothetical protein M758_12G172400 [Ceratodon purpureus]
MIPPTPAAKPQTQKYNQIQPGSQYPSHPKRSPVPSILPPRIPHHRNSPKSQSKPITKTVSGRAVSTRTPQGFQTSINCPASPQLPNSSASPPRQINRRPLLSSPLLSTPLPEIRPQKNTAPIRLATEYVPSLRTQNCAPRMHSHHPNAQK